MANVLNGNTFYVDAASSAGTTASFINEKDILVEAVTVSAGGSSGGVVLNDLKYTNGTYSAGDAKLHLEAASRTSYMQYFNGTPIRFPNGVWVSSIDANVYVTLLVRRKA